MRHHFITGLPRSGSTLLAAILRQNPRFAASIMTPVGAIVTGMITNMGPSNEASRFLTEDHRLAMLRGVFAGFYSGLDPAVEVAFDNNRRWTANVSALARLYPDCSLLCCVRDPAAIIDSFERLFQKNPLTPSPIHGGEANLTVYSRTSELMKPSGVLGYALDALRSAFFGPERHRLLMVEYESLCQFPAELVADIYKALGEPPFEHRFNEIGAIPGAAEFDAGIDTPGLHDLKPVVRLEPRFSVLPPDLYSALPEPFWRINEPETSTG